MTEQHDMEALKEAQAAWMGSAAKAPQTKAEFKTPSQIPVNAAYSPLDLEDAGYPDDVGYPGEFPFLRGVHPTGYRGRLWTMRMFAGYGTAEETNERFKYLLENGQTGLSVAFDMPTLYGYDTDAPQAAGEFGKCGVAISSLADMEVLFDEIPLQGITTSMTINSPAAIVWAMYIAVAEQKGLAIDSMGGTLQNDILKEYIAQNEYIFPPEPSMRLVVDTIEFASKHMPRWNPISISGYHIREAGATAVQELAFTLEDGREYVRWGLARGLDIDDFAPRLSFFFNVDNYFFEEIAKLRAARKIWAQEMRDTFHAKDPRSWWMRTHAQTAGWSLTAQQPENNAIRVGIQALAAVMGGAQSLHTNSMDEAWALPSEQAVLLALRTQQVIAHESGVANIVDPLGGSYYLESLTRQMETEAHDYFHRIEDLGGVLPSIEMGYFQQEIAGAAYRYQLEVDRGERITVGVNKYVTGDAPEIPLLRMDEEGEAHHLERLNGIRRNRDGRQVRAKLAELGHAARNDQNLMVPLIEAVKAYATLGEMMDVLREVFGEYQPTWGY